jgi:septum formation protein
MLSALSGNRHRVYTGVTVIQGDKEVTQSEETIVTFREIEPDEISHYIATGEPMDKAGAYGIQGLGALLVSGIEGDYFNVMGLPVYRLGRILADFGIDLLERAAQ